MNNAMLSLLVTIFNVHPHLFPQNKILNCQVKACLGLLVHITISKIVFTVPPAFASTVYDQGSMCSCQLEEEPEAPFFFNLYHLLHKSLTSSKKHLLEWCAVGKTRMARLSSHSKEKVGKKNEIQHLLNKYICDI